MTFDRFVFSPPGSWPLEQAVDWASAHRFTRVDFNADGPANYPQTFDADRLARVRAQAERAGVTLGIHTSSAVNMAEITPVMAAAADAYVEQNLKLAAALGCDHVVCHGGFHFTTDYEARAEAGLARMSRAAEMAESLGVDVYFENHNWEPEHAEIHYLPHTVAEFRPFVERITSPRFKWAANVGHALLVQDGFDGFLDAFGVARIGHVRLHDTHGNYEEHLLPGQGIVDFKALFGKLSRLGYRGPFTLDFGSPDQRASWRDTFADWLAASG